MTAGELGETMKSTTESEGEDQMSAVMEQLDRENREYREKLDRMGGPELREEKERLKRMRESRGRPPSQTRELLNTALAAEGVPMLAAPPGAQNVTVELLPDLPSEPDMREALLDAGVPMTPAHRLAPVPHSLLREAEGSTHVPLVRGGDEDAALQTARTLMEGAESPPLTSDGLVDLAAHGIPVTRMRESNYTDAERQEMAKRGEARPDGSLPLRTREDVENAVKAWPLTSDPDDRAHICRRAKAIGAVDLLPADWHDGTGGVGQ